MKSYWKILISLSLLLSSCAQTLMNDEMEQEMNEEIVPTSAETSTLAFSAEYAAHYPDWEDFTNSSAVAKVNGYLGRYGTLQALEEHLPQLGALPLNYGIR